MKPASLSSVRRAAAAAALLLAAAVAAATDASPSVQAAIPSSSTRPTTAPAPVSGGLPNVKVTDVPAPDYSGLPRDADGRRVAARVNGEPIFLEELRMELRQRTPHLRNADEQQRLAVESVITSQVLEALVTGRLAEQYARTAGIRVLDEEVTRTLQAKNEMLPPGRKMQDLALSAGMSIPQLHDMTRRELLLGKVRDIVTSTVVVTDADIPTTDTPGAGLGMSQQATAEMLEQETGVEEIRASHIVLRSIEGTSTQTEALAREKAGAVLSLIRSGMDFAEAARQYSQDGKTAANGGDLGYFTPRTMYPAFEAAAFALKPGEVSDVVRTPVGFHIIKVTDHRTGRLRSRTQTVKRDAEFQRWRDALRATADVEKYL